jgi:hypothetical protein
MSVTLSSGNLTPDQLRQLVLDYLCHNCYTETARAFRRASTVRQLDADGDEVIEDAASEDIVGAHNSGESFEDQLRQIELRNEIRTHIMSGRVDEATAMLDQHFPSVLSEESDAYEQRPTTNNTEYVSSTSTEPAHLNLNLRILAFSEACRTIPLNYSPKADSSADEIPADAMITDDEEGVESYDKQMALLQRAQKLYAYTTTLPNPVDRDTYLKELENVGGLLAYKVPEKSSISKYLTLERREAVADQISRAILKRTGRPIFSSLEILTRHTQVSWDYARDCQVKPRAGAIYPPRNVNDTANIPVFDLPTFLDSKP